MQARASGGGRLASAAVFARATGTYWGSVFPQVAHELAMWRERAHEIPDPALRAQALEALAKRGNMEGAAAFATFVGREQRPAVVRAAVAFQTAYNHLDTVSEQAEASGPEQARVQHAALLDALASRRPGGRSAEWEPSAEGHDHARPIHPPKKHESGYVQALVESCQDALSELPAYAVVAPAARRAAERVVSFQAYNRRERADIEQWGREQTPPGSALRWWEAAAAGGSSLGVHVMIAAAAEPKVSQAQVDALEQAYFPWIGALHSMLDQLVDIDEDRQAGQPNLVELYGSPARRLSEWRCWPSAPWVARGVCSRGGGTSWSWPRWQASIWRPPRRGWGRRQLLRRRCSTCSASCPGRR